MKAAPPGWFSSAGFVDVRLDPSPMSVPWPLFRSMMMLDDAAQRAMADGVLSSERYEGWLDEQAGRHAAGTLTAVTIGYRCFGTSR